MFSVENRRSQDIFQSTLSVRRATRELRDRPGRGRISIHALRKESDDTSGMKGAYINLNDFPSPSQMASPVYEDVYENCGIIRVVMPYLETPIASMPFTGGRLLLVLAAISSLSLVVGLVLLRPQKTGRKH